MAFALPGELSLSHPQVLALLPFRFSSPSHLGRVSKQPWGPELPTWAKPQEPVIKADFDCIHTSELFLLNLRMEVPYGVFSGVEIAWLLDLKILSSLNFLSPLIPFLPL